MTWALAPYMEPTSKSKMGQRRERAEQPHLVARDAQLLLQLAQGGVGQAAVPAVRLAAGERDLPRVVAHVLRPLDRPDLEAAAAEMERDADRGLDAPDQGLPRVARRPGGDGVREGADLSDRI